MSYISSTKVFYESITATDSTLSQEDRLPRRQMSQRRASVIATRTPVPLRKQLNDLLLRLYSLSP